MSITLHYKAHCPRHGDYEGTGLIPPPDKFVHGPVEGTDEHCFHHPTVLKTWTEPAPTVFRFGSLVLTLSRSDKKTYEVLVESTSLDPEVKVTVSTETEEKEFAL